LVAALRFPRDFTVSRPRCYNKRGTAEQLIKEGKQAVKMTWLSCPRFRSNEAIIAEPDRLNSGEPVAATGVAAKDRQLVAHQLAATFGENRRATGKARTLPLAAVGGKPSDPAAVRQRAAANRSTTNADRVAGEEVPDEN